MTELGLPQEALPHGCLPSTGVAHSLSVGIRRSRHPGGDAKAAKRRGRYAPEWTCQRVGCSGYRLDGGLRGGGPRVERDGAKPVVYCVCERFAHTDAPANREPHAERNVDAHAQPVAEPKARGPAQDGRFGR